MVSTTLTLAEGGSLALAKQAARSPQHTAEPTRLILSETLRMASPDARTLPHKTYGRALLRLTPKLNASAVAVVLNEVKVVAP